MPSLPSALPAPTKSTPRSDGTITGTLKATDGDGDPLRYFGGGTSTKGTLTVYYDGTYTYTPKADARLAAWGTPANDPKRIDTFDVSVYDGFGAAVTTTISFTIQAAVPPIEVHYGSQAESSPTCTHCRAGR